MNRLQPVVERERLKSTWGGQVLFALTPDSRYREAMAKANRIDFDDPAPIDEDEDEETLAAIDQGIRDAEAGRTVPIKEIRAVLRQWITASSSRKKR
jgi:predicted transcriptional regulator